MPETPLIEKPMVTVFAGAYVQTAIGFGLT
jgi:hypothetical protein